MNQNKQDEFVFVMVKPDGVKRYLREEILQRIKKTNLRLIVAKSLTPTAQLAVKHFQRKRDGSSGLSPAQATQYLTSGPVCITIWRGKEAVKRVRSIVGSYTSPNICEIGTIRRDFSEDSIENAKRENRAVRNIIHSSHCPISALSEITIWFGKNWKRKFGQP